MQKYIVIVGCFLVLLSCGKNNSGGGAAGVSQGLPGSSWVGTFKPQTGKDEFGPNRNVRMELKADQSFSITPTDSSTGTVKGTFKDLPKTKAVIFNVSESEKDNLGLKGGETYDYSYDLNGDELVITGTTGKYLLAREGTTPDSGGATAAAHKFVGDWQCEDPAGGRFSINVAEKDFRGRKEQPGQRTIFFEGPIISKSEDAETKVRQIIIEVKSSSINSIVGNKLKMFGTEDKASRLIQLDASGTTVPDTEIVCRML